MKYAVLNFCKETATGRGGNLQIVMEQKDDYIFSVTEGQIGIKYGRQRPKKYEAPMSEWESFMQMKIDAGFLLYSDKKLEKKEIEIVQNSDGNSYKSIDNPDVKQIVENLLLYAQKCMEENFKISVVDIPEPMIEKGKEILEDLAKNYENMSLAVFNNKLKALFMSMPRRIPDINKVLAKRPADFNDILAKEQDLFDIMISQVRQGKMAVTTSQTILEAFGITIESCTKEEKDAIKKMMRSEGNRFINAWRVKNLATEKRFNEFCAKEGFEIKEDLENTKNVTHLFHRSRNENFWSIITNGLTINPTGVVITGKAYGNGTYFAPDACKSVGYTSRRGAKWTSGGSDVGYMGIYKVATGVRYNGSRGCNSRLNWEELQRIHPGAHCTWAECRYSGFMMDEVIVYRDEQSTIEFLVQIGI